MISASEFLGAFIIAILLFLQSMVSNKHLLTGKSTVLRELV